MLINPHRAFSLYQSVMPTVSQSVGPTVFHSVTNRFRAQPQPAGQSAFSPGLPANGPLLTQTYRSPNGYPITLYTLPNGHRLMVEQRPADFVGVRTFVNAGSAMENGIKDSPLYPATGVRSGIAHLDEHSHFLATQNFPQKNSLTQAMGQLGAKWNATTGDEMIQHELFFNREDVNQALRLHTESVLRPLYTSPDMGQEKDAVLNENLFRMGEVDNKLLDQFNDLMFDRPFRQTLGTLNDVQQTSAQDLQRFHNQVYAPTNMLTLVTGNVNPQEILNILAPDLLSNPARNLATPPGQIRSALKPGEVRAATVADPRLSNAVVHLGFSAPPLNNYRDRMAMEFLMHILGGNSLSVLNKALVNESGLATSVSVEYNAMKQTGVCQFSLNTPLGREREAASAMLNQLATFPKRQITNEQLAETREILTQHFRSVFDNARIASRVLGKEALNNTLPYLLNYEKIASLITPEDLQDVARKYFTPDSYALVYGLPGPAQPQVPAPVSGGAA